MIKLLRMIGTFVVLALMAVSSFFLARAFFHGEREAAAGVSPVATAEEALGLSEAAPPQPFEGELNGFTFFRSGTIDHWALLRAWSPKCTGNPTTGTNVRYVTEEMGRASRLNFAVTYLPPGAQQNYVSVSTCEDDVINIQRTYGDSQTGHVSIFRQSGPPLVPYDYPRERLEPRTIGGRPAVILHPVRPKGRMAIHLRDGVSRWVISGFQISLDELIKVAEGVK